ncbi:PAS domain S-box protein [Desulfovibrio sulfodismutans]|uniref:PAS domain S-box protein n=1 Tax=Desulfolutivibrio sulfodismutans TaxID=63561 RepID=A0A7K3NIK1_9BACT|nr:sigma 54-interacting transcriptional regulator [Desulfolutivibrio sulfodismutans]NDY55927.1 PAS domain S-box protein [Desulfolutivibrio sulfodismutans]QLA11189.1 PAS domain S-box protein [Desulfolutivibrio sulfodismutans DSM 3696]
MLTQGLDEYWRTVVNTIQDGVMIVDTQGRIVSVNTALEEITGYARQELVGSSCTIINCTSCELARDSEGCHWCVMFQKGELRRQRCAISRKDGSVIHIVKNASVLKDASGMVIGAVETMTDVTDLLEKETQIETYRRELLAEDTFHGLIGRSPAMFQVYDMISNAAQSDAPVIIYGESGTGKELAAIAVHKAGARGGKPFIKVNCAALNESLLESELFGHVKGAYTGAHRNRTGRFEVAADGDIFLDEIGDMPLSTQVKLLRVLEDRVIERVGDNQPIPVQARIISATNRDLPTLVGQGAFRRDFYYRINVIPIKMPPLRARKEDIPLLAEAFFRRIKLKYEKKNIQGIARETMDVLMRYPWPGNVRELKSAFEYAFIACRGDVLEPNDLPGDIAQETAAPSTPPLSAVGDLDAIRKERLVAALRASGGNQSEAARQLGISRTTIWSQIKRFGITEP